MNDPTNNLLLNLFYGTWKKDENFHTEALVHLLRHLLRYDPVGAINILKAITNGLMVLSLDDVKAISINTQVRTSKGFRPDVEIRTLTHLIYIEVKVEASLHKGQIEEYRKALEDSGFSNTSLVLLTKYPFNPENEETPDFNEYWCWMHELDMSSETTRFFKLSKSAQLQRIEQFLKDSFDAVKQLPPS